MTELDKQVALDALRACLEGRDDDALALLGTLGPFALGFLLGSIGRYRLTALGYAAAYYPSAAEEYNDGSHN